MKRNILNHSSTWKKKVGNASGFTLLELMIVVAIFVALMAIAIPNFETMVYGSTSERAMAELVGVLQNARMKAIKTHGDVTVDFNVPAANQMRVTWTENNVVFIRDHDLSPNPGRITFDAAPPGGAQPPDATFTFTNLGFIRPAAGLTTSNIYILDNQNGRNFHVAATIAGGIVERQWNGAAWDGPIL